MNAPLPHLHAAAINCSTQGCASACQHIMFKGPVCLFERAAHAVHPISAVQLEWSLWTRDAEKEVIPTCRELGIAIVVRA